MVCPYCEQQNPENVNFCNNCGARVNGICGECGAQNSLGSKYCQECGVPLLIMNKIGGSAAPNKATSAATPAERRQLTIFFCDLVGSTQLSEQLDAEEYRKLILNYQQVANEVIIRYGGHIAQYLGDGLLVYFGYPEGLEDAPRAGIRAGLGILEALTKSDQSHNGHHDMSVRIGIHTGLVVVDGHLAMGEAANIAARLQAIAPANGLVISEQTLMLVQGWFEIRNLGSFSLRGVSRPKEIFQVLGESGIRSKIQVAINRGISPLIGRDDELNLLTSSWELSKGGQGQAVVLKGEPGIGKSRLIETFKRQIASEPQTLIMEMHCSAYHQNSAFYPVIEWLEQEVLKFDKQDTAERKIAKLNHFLQRLQIDNNRALSITAALLSLPWKEEQQKLDAGPSSEKQIIMAILQQILIKGSGLARGLLIVEDVHWVDASTLEWLDMLMEQLPKSSWMVLITTRQGIHPGWLGKPSVIPINLHRLGAEQIEALCMHKTNGKKLPTEVMEHIKMKTNGVPLFVEELTWMILESGLLTEKDERFELSGPLPPLAIPSTLQDSLMARLDKLSYLKEVAQICAVLGHEFSFEVLLEVSQLPSHKLAHDLQALVASELIYQKGSDSQAIYLFKHALIRDAAYQSLLKSKRQQLHQRAVQVLSTTFSKMAHQQPEIIAHHLTMAGLPSAAVDKWMQAARYAEKRFANKEAIQHLEQGLAIVSQLDKKEQQNLESFKMLLFLSQLSLSEYGFGHPEYKKVNERLVKAAEAVGKLEEVFGARLALIAYEMGDGNLDLQSEMDNLLELAKLKEDPFHLGACHLLRGFIMFISGNYAASKENLETALTNYRHQQHHTRKMYTGGNLKVEALAQYALVLHLSGYPDQALARIKECGDLARKLSSVIDLSVFAIFEGLLLLCRKEYAKAEQTTTFWLNFFEGSAFSSSFVGLIISILWNVAHAYGGDREAASQAFLLTQKLSLVFKTIHTAYSFFPADAYQKMGNTKRALLILENGLADRHQPERGHYLPELYRLKGICLAEQDPLESEHYLLKALQISKQQGARWHELLAAKQLALLWQSQGQGGKGYEVLSLVYNRFTEGFELVDMQESKVLLNQLASVGHGVT